MRNNSTQVLKWLSLSEGGYVNDPKDPGGPTNRGITERVWHSWQQNNGREQSSIKLITRKEADRIFVEQYFNPVWFNRLPPGLDYCLADYSVNSGPARAVKELQRVLNSRSKAGLTVDGVMGNNTLAALKEDDDTVILITTICSNRLKFMRSLRHWKRFKNGWTSRVNGVVKRGTEMARGQELTQGYSGDNIARAPEDAVNPILKLILTLIKLIFGVTL
jgi:lysozyme family protein